MAKQREKKRIQVLNYLMRGGKHTVIDINTACNTADTRKYISELRKAGHRIKDVIMDDRTGTKVYWYESETDALQLSLF